MSSSNEQNLEGPDLRIGVEISSLAENSPLLGHVDGEAAMLVRKGEEIFAIGATCSHYSGPLAEGLVVGETVHCPWHHARFSLRSGEAVGCPALNPVPCFAIRKENGHVRVDRKLEVDFKVALPNKPDSVVIIGAGAAGAACADQLRSKGYDGPVTLVGDEEPGPVDRPNLSKDYLAGTAQEEWIPLRSREYYESIQVELIVRDPALKIDPAARKVSLQSGRVLDYGALLLATGAEPRTLSVEGSGLPHVRLLRTLADSREIIALSEKAKRCVVIGSSFIGLEVAASLRHRKIEVTVVGHEDVPLAKVLGQELGKWVQDLHEQNGVHFVPGASPVTIRKDRVELSNGSSIEADLVVLGVGVSPRTSLAEACGLTVDNGVIVDENLRTSDANIYAAGDIARYPDPISGERTRIEHWVVAERQGQAAARTMLGLGKGFRDVPFFWSQHYDVAISYIGHASSWDNIEVRGSLAERSACVIYRKNGKVLALATIGRDHLSLAVEAAMEAGDVAEVETLLQAQ